MAAASEPKDRYKARKRGENDSLPGSGFSGEEQNKRPHEHRRDNSGFLASQREEGEAPGAECRQPSPASCGSPHGT